MLLCVLVASEKCHFGATRKFRCSAAFLTRRHRTEAKISGNNCVCNSECLANLFMIACTSRATTVRRRDKPSEFGSKYGR